MELTDSQKEKMAKLKKDFQHKKDFWQTEENNCKVSNDSIGHVLAVHQKLSYENSLSIVTILLEP